MRGAVDQHWVARARYPFLAPLPKRQQHRQQVAALFRQAIGDLAPVGGVGRAFENVVLDEPRQPVRKDVAGDAQRRLELFEMVETVEGAAQDQERPAFADRLKRGGDRALPQQLTVAIKVQQRARPVSLVRAAMAQKAPVA